MRIGQKIICKLYPEYKDGIIISRQNVFGREYYKIFFENVNKIIEIPKDDIEPINTSLELYKSHIFYEDGVNLNNHKEGAICRE